MDFINQYPPYCQYDESWPVQGRMRVSLGLANTLPPDAVRSSIMTILVDRHTAIYYLTPMYDAANIAHVLIGGRPEPGEIYHETIIREAGEETGYRIKPLAILGYRYFHQLDPRSPETDRPYPDFIQPILLSRALEKDDSLLIAEDALPGGFVDFTTAYTHIHAAQRGMLDQIKSIVSGA